MMPAQQNSELVSLRYLLEGLADVTVDVMVGAPSVDARDVQEKGVFFAVAGSKAHGLMHVEQAIHAGAIAVVYDPAAGGEFLAEKAKKQHKVHLIELPDLSVHLSKIAARFYNSPANNLSVIGITGTNGKTSVSHFIAQALSDEKQASGVIGTLGWGVLDALTESINTTPDAISVQSQLANLKHAGLDTVAMEVSSHGLAQGRVNDVAFKGAVFTNLSHDHLDYHETMAAYGEAKLALFKCQSLEFAVLNKDDAFSDTIIQTLAPTANVLLFSRQAGGENTLLISNEALIPRGLMFDVSFNGQSARIQSSLFGAFNIDNLVATLGVLIGMGYAFDEAVRKITAVKSVSGRMQLISQETPAPTVVVDYAHTPDALKMALMSLREHCDGTLSLVFGCGGNRDEAKRPLMGAIAQQYADNVVITNDNPRFESADDIAEQIKQGMDGVVDVTVMLDRQQAIQQTITHCGVNDIILVAGKGHERYQQVGDKKLPFNDVDEVLVALKNWPVAGEGGCAI